MFELLYIEARSVPYVRAIAASKREYSFLLLDFVLEASTTSTWHFANSFNSQKLKKMRISNLKGN